MQQTQLIGLLLWRIGLLVAGGWAFFEGARWALQFIDLPVQIEVGLGLGVVGIAFLLISFLLERFADARVEGNLSDGESNE